MADKKREVPPEVEPKIKLYKASIQVTLEVETVEEARRKVRKALQAALDDFDAKNGVTRIVKAKYSSRADQLSEAMAKVEDAKSTIEDLGEQMDEWFNNLPQSFQDGDKGQMLQEAKDNLETVASNLDEAIGNAESVEFPGMFS